MTLSQQGAPGNAAVPGAQIGSLTAITSVNGTLNAVFSVVTNTGSPSVLVQFNQTTTITAGAIQFKVSFDGTNFVNVSADAVIDPTSTTNATISMPYTLQASTNKAFMIWMKGAQALQILMSTGLTGTGSVTPFYSTQPNIELNTLTRVTGNAGGAVDAATGAAPPANAVQVGGITSGATNGFLTGVPVCDSYKAINVSSATTTLLVTGVASRQVRICAFHMFASIADNVAFIEGTGATCGTGSAGMAGGTTAASGYNIGATGGIAHGDGLGTVMRTVTTGDSVCVVTSSAAQLSGGMSYAIY